MLEYRIKLSNNNKMSNYEYSDEIDQEIVDFLENHKNNGTSVDEIDGLLKLHYPEFHNSLNFGICAIIDEIYTGSSGGFWRLAYDNAKTGQIIYKSVQTNYNENETIPCKIFVNFAGIYTCDLNFDCGENSEIDSE